MFPQPPGTGADSFPGGEPGRRRHVHRFSVTTMSQMAGGATASAASSLATGSLMGNAAAQVEDPMSLLADAAEELTFAADTTDEYELEDRKERERAESAYAERVKLYQDLMHEAGKSQNIDR
ncbi:MAG: hypothetical protein ACLSAH_10220 [Bilophila wadsworthia]